MQQAHLHLIKWAIAKGYTFEVWGDGEELDYKGGQYQAAKEAAEACDTADITLWDGDKQVAWFYIVNWNEGAEIVSDFSANEVGDSWWNDYEATA